MYFESGWSKAKLLLNSSLIFSGLELPMLSTEQISPAPTIHHNQLRSYSDLEINQLMSYSENFSSDQVYPTPHSALPEELILQKPPTGPVTAWFHRWTTRKGRKESLMWYYQQRKEKMEKWNIGVEWKRMVSNKVSNTVSNTGRWMKRKAWICQIQCQRRGDCAWCREKTEHQSNVRKRWKTTIYTGRGACLVSQIQCQWGGDCAWCRDKI